MKTQISRDSFLPEQGYSGVYLQQGRMILDADWNELTDIQKAQLANALRDAISGTTGAAGDIAGGSPRAGGLKIAANPAGSANIFIQPGALYVEGVAARLPGTDPLAVNAQPEYPIPLQSSSSYTGMSLYLYADVWERNVTALEQSNLMDAAMHGADTATRSQTMLQAKWCATSIKPMDPAQNPAMGNAPLKLKLRLIDSSGDACDPCASQVQVEERIGNYLFRVEVHDYQVTASERTLTLKWSRDNGSEACAVAQMPDGFDEGDWVWEYFDDDTEKLLGNHFASGVDTNKLRGRIQGNCTTPGAGYPSTYVRQWDGYIKIKLDSYVIVEGKDRGVDLYKGTVDDEAHGRVDLAGGVLKINLKLMELELTAGSGGTKRAFVPGDYWLAPVREAEDESGDIVLGDETAGAAPRGIWHHYLFLGELAADGKLVAQDDAYARRMNFPPLTDIHAADIAFIDHCAGLYAGANNVQQALDNLCAIGAEDIAYLLPNCGANEGKSIKDRLKSSLDPDGNGKLTVQVALDKLLCELNATSLPYTVPACSATPSIGSLLGLAASTSSNVAPMLDKLLCELNAAKLPYILPSCADNPNVFTLLGLGSADNNVAAVLGKLLCGFNAGDMPLDKSDAELCSDLQVSEAVTVQDALKILCNKSGGGCAVTVSSSEQLELLLGEFAAGDATDLWLCLKAGTYPITKDIAIAGKRSLRISGQGRESTSIVFGGTTLSVDADEIIIENVSFDISNGNGQMTLTAASSQVSNCRFTRQRSISVVETPPAMIGIGSPSKGAARIQWRNNILYAMLYSRFGMIRGEVTRPTSSPDYALRLENSLVGGILEGNQIDGYLLFGNGIEGFATPAAGGIKQVRIAGLVATGGEDLHLLSNRITAIKANLGTANADGYLDEQVQANTRLVLSNNRIERTENAISAKNIVVSGNYWAGGTSDLGYCIADRASFTGNIVEDDANKSKFTCTLAETQLIASGNILLQVFPMLV
ncbi:MAG: hypothetical protein HY850_03630 [Betaproteobacteria bacterium]|nr:hypothetical protein [Betaproteobacteria bacterium]